MLHEFFFFTGIYIKFKSDHIEKYHFILKYYSRYHFVLDCTKAITTLFSSHLLSYKRILIRLLSS